MPAVRVRFGVLGLGLGSRFMLPFLASHQRVALVAAADPRPEARDRFVADTGGWASPSADELIGSPDIEALYVATPSHLHEAHVVAAAAAGKHLIVEKPLAISDDECRRIIEAVRSHGVQLVCGHSHCFDPPMVLARQIVESGELGRPVHGLTFNFTDFIYRPRPDWERGGAGAGGVVLNQAPHQVDILRSVLGPAVAAVDGATYRTDPDRPMTGAYAALLRFDDGVAATMTYSGYGYFDSSVFTGGIGERGYPRDPDTHARTWEAYLQRRAGGGTGAEEDARNGRRVGVPTVVEGERPGLPSFGVSLFSCEWGDVHQVSGGIEVITRSGRDRRSAEALPAGGHAVVDELLQAVEDGVEPLHGAAWGADTVSVCTAIERSSNMAAPVRPSRQAEAPCA